MKIECPLCRNQYEAGGGTQALQCPSCLLIWTAQTGKWFMASEIDAGPVSIERTRDRLPVVVELVNAGVALADLIFRHRPMVGEDFAVQPGDGAVYSSEAFRQFRIQLGHYLSRPLAEWRARVRVLGGDKRPLGDLLRLQKVVLDRIKNPSAILMDDIALEIQFEAVGMEHAREAARIAMSVLLRENLVYGRDFRVGYCHVSQEETYVYQAQEREFS